jgi:hypothetical protein
MGDLTQAEEGDLIHTTTNQLELDATVFSREKKDSAFMIDCLAVNSLFAVGQDADLVLDSRRAMQCTSLHGGVPAHPTYT